MHKRLEAFWPVLAAGVVASALVFGQSEEPAPGAGARAVTKWEYKLIAWTGDDTEAALRLATGDPMSSVEDMATLLADEMSPINHPKLQTAVDARVQERLQAAGAEGWELAWIRASTTVSAGYVLPAPSLFCKRPRP